MFKSFFPKPGTFFLSAFVWALIAVIFWQAGGGDWVARITGASGQIPISAARFWSLDFLIFYAYYIVCEMCIRDRLCCGRVEPQHQVRSTIHRHARICFKPRI